MILLNFSEIYWIYKYLNILIIYYYIHVCVCARARARVCVCVRACTCKRVRVSRILERRFTPRFSVPRGETPRKRPRPSLSSTPIFAQNPGFVTPREVVRRRNAGYASSSGRFWPMPATWVTGEPAETAPNPLVSSSCCIRLSLSLWIREPASGNELLLNRVIIARIYREFSLLLLIG